MRVYWVRILQIFVNLFVYKVADYILFVRKIAESAIFAGFAKLQSLQMIQINILYARKSAESTNGVQ